MYIIFPCILLFLLLCALLMLYRRKNIIKKICRMSVHEKLCRLNELIHPFGFEYLLSQDIFTSCFGAWQRDFGYCSTYDSHADLFNMVLDCEPVYFDYEGCTWLLELWKGQYGINIGAEIGIYKTDSLIPKIYRQSAMFHSVPDKDLPFFEMTLYHGTTPLYRVAQRHWWLTGFRMGEYAVPDTLTLKVSILFPSSEMQRAFTQGLKDCGYPSYDIDSCGQQVSFNYSLAHASQPKDSHRIRTAFAQWENRLFLKLYCHVTKPFCFTIDKLLYLYEYLPFVFRRMAHIRHMIHSRRHKSERRHTHVR